MSTRELPQWAIDMTDEEWDKLGDSYNNCSVCGRRLILALCSYEESLFYCVEHCPEHRWQADHDWPAQCIRCGITYVKYLESVLQNHGIEYNSRVDDK